MNTMSRQSCSALVLIAQKGLGRSYNRQLSRSLQHLLHSQNHTNRSSLKTSRTLFSDGSSSPLSVLSGGVATSNPTISPKEENSATPLAALAAEPAQELEDETPMKQERPNLTTQGASDAGGPEEMSAIVSRGRLLRVVDRRDLGGIAGALEKIVQEGVALSPEVCSKVVEVLADLGTGYGTDRALCAELVFTLYDYMFQREIVPERAFYCHYMRACAAARHAEVAAHMHAELLKRDLVPQGSARHYGPYLAALFAALGGRSRRARVALREYERAREGGFLPRAPPPPPGTVAAGAAGGGGEARAAARAAEGLYAQAVTFYVAQGGNAGAAFRVLQDMAAAGLRPPLGLAHRVLDAALDDMDAAVLAKAVPLLLNLGGRPDRGQTAMLLTAAANRGDAALAIKGWSLLQATGAAGAESEGGAVGGGEAGGGGGGPVARAPPVREPHDAAVATALFRARKDREAIAFLAEVEAAGRGLAPLSARQCGDLLGRSVRRLDHSYYCALDLAGKARAAAAAAAPEGEAAAPAAPRAALAAVLWGCAALGNAGLDRAFATFEDLRPAFGLAPDADMYAALVACCANPERPQSGAARSLLARMEGEGLRPGRHALDAAMRAAFLRKDEAEVAQLLARMTAEGLAPLPPTTVLLANSYLSTAARGKGEGEGGGGGGGGGGGPSPSGARAEVLAGLLKHAEGGLRRRLEAAVAGGGGGGGAGGHRGAGGGGGEPAAAAAARAEA